MAHELSVADALRILEHETGIVIPVYFRPADDREQGEAILRETVHMFAREVAEPCAICLSVDGSGPAVEIAASVAKQYGTQVVYGERNRGKFAAVQLGMQTLLAPGTSWRYLASVDQDGDHFANELLNFVRAAEHVQASAIAATGVVVLGNRLSRHKPLGFLRGEQEELANRVTMDALTYDAALRGKPLILQFANSIDDVPDIHSGYKLFSRSTAEAVFLAPPQLAGCSEDAYYRHACEAVMLVETIKSGAILATVYRRTFDEQPMSIFASLNRAQLHADLIIWPCKRLGIPGHFVEQWLANHLHRLLLGTLAPQGREELLAIRDLVLEAFERPLPANGHRDIVRSRFV
jgi:hypothetical protein